MFGKFLEKALNSDGLEALWTTSLASCNKSFPCGSP